MAAAQDLEHGQMFSNSDPLLQPGSLSIAKYRKRSGDRKEDTKCSGYEANGKMGRGPWYLAGESTQLVTLYLTVVVSPNATSHPMLPISAPILQPTEINDLPSGEAEKPSVPQDSTNPTRPTMTTGSSTLSPPTDRRPSETSTPIPPAADRRGVSLENALHGADGVMTIIELSNKWEGALERIKWVMETLSPVAEVRYRDDVVFMSP
ncbi:hypothetical protein EDB83DRAFT_2555426 [Lactarius deliciosus]|nr:hypothetical protein EDB83DRAFT_2555426 [Lactarius deliciosus]